MNGAQLNQRIRDSLAILVESADELGELDQALGDGDLGITITAGSNAVSDALGGLSPDASPTEIARTCAKEFADANPSTMAALVAGALLAGSRVWDGVDDISVDDAAAFARAASDSIAQRGKTQVGDKTILDGVSAATDAIEAADDARQAAEAASAAAAAAVASTVDIQSRRGRASWLQERSIGHPDPGATAFQRFVEAWVRADSGSS